MTDHTLPVTLRLTAKEGLDPRLAARLAVRVSHFDCEVTLACNGHVVNAKSVSEMIALSAPHNALVDLHAQGPQAQAAVNALIAVLQDC